MAKRLSENVERLNKVTLSLNGQRIVAFAGETLVTVIMLSGNPVCKKDRSGLPRAPFCNMGVCYDCMVEVSQDGQQARQVRACMTSVRQGMVVRTQGKTGTEANDF